jgi:hypothetical protein
MMLVSVPWTFCARRTDLPTAAMATRSVIFTLRLLTR